MKENIKLVYIDDDLDISLSRYLHEEYQNREYDIDYLEVLFDGEKGYEYLLAMPEVTEANVILIDSRLFENNKIKNQGKFTGEEFRMILRKVFPFIEVLVVSQNGENEDYDILQKYRSGGREDSNVYYNKILKKPLDERIQRVMTFRNISKKLEKNSEIEPVLIEKITNSLNGIGKYDELTTKDIDYLVSAFQDLVR